MASPFVITKAVIQTTGFDKNAMTGGMSKKTGVQEIALRETWRDKRRGILFPLKTVMRTARSKNVTEFPLPVYAAYVRANF